MDTDADHTRARSRGGGGSTRSSSGTTCPLGDEDAGEEVDSGASASLEHTWIVWRLMLAVAGARSICFSHERGQPRQPECHCPAWFRWHCLHSSRELLIPAAAAFVLMSARKVRVNLRLLPLVLSSQAAPIMATASLQLSGGSRAVSCTRYSTSSTLSLWCEIFGAHHFAVSSGGLQL